MTRKEKFNFVDKLDLSSWEVRSTVNKCVRDFYQLDCIYCFVYHDLKLLYVYAGAEYVKICFNVSSVFSGRLEYVSFYYPFKEFLRVYNDFFKYWFSII